MPRKKKLVRKFNGKRYRKSRSYTMRVDALKKKRQLRSEGWLVRIIKEKALRYWVGERQLRTVYVVWKRRKDKKRK